MTPVVFLDFDGTITCRDATDAILEAYADPLWQRIEDEWKRGLIGSRECLTRQMALVSATPAQIDSLLDTIEIDEGFVALLTACAARGVPVHVVSDGFDYCIRRILARPRTSLAPLVRGLEIVSSRLEYRGARWHASFTPRHAPCAHGCGTCKPEVMRLLNPDGRRTIFVGDGLSDRHAVAHADVVFAKNGLAAYCDAQLISHTRYEHLGAVAEYLGRLLEPNTERVIAAP